MSGAVIQAVTAITAIGALIFTNLSLDATREGQYTKAVEQLGQQGADRLQVRLGGIYALERLAVDSPRDQPTVVQVLSAFIRTTTARVPQDSRHRPACPDRAVPPDVEAALRVIASRDTAQDGGAVVDLSTACLDAATPMITYQAGGMATLGMSGVDLEGARLSGARLLGTSLTNADLERTDLRHAILAGTWLTKARLLDAGLDQAVLFAADLGEANLAGAKLTGAGLDSANLQRANLAGADLSGADLSGADLLGADLSGADLTGVVHDAQTRVDGVVTDAKTAGKWW